MARHGGAWRRLMESTEGPTVQVALPREWAEELLRSLAASLEMGDGLDGDMEDPDADPEMDMDADADLGMGDPGGDMGLDLDDPMGDEPDFAAGDDDGDEPLGPPEKKGPGRPPGSKNKPKSDDGAPKKKDAPKKDKPKDDDGDDDEKDENLDFSAGPTDGFRPGTALGESAFARAARAISVRRHPRAPRR